MPNEKKSWDISKYIKVTVLPDKEFQQNLKAQQRLQQATETLALPTDPNVDLVKKDSRATSNYKLGLEIN